MGEISEMSPMRRGDAFIHSFAVSHSVYSGFVATFNDRNPYHVDDEAARAKGFAGRIMHGNILCGFLSYFVGEQLPVKSVVIQAQEIQFHRPVYLNDVVTLHADVADFFESVMTAEIRFRFENQHGVKVAKGKLRVGIL